MTAEDKRAASPSRREWLGLLVCFLIGVLVVYHRILSTPFMVDDYYLLARLSDGFVHLFAKIGAHFFRPLIGLTLWLDRAIWGLNPLGYHLTNVIIHGLNSFLVAVVGYLLMQDRGLSRRTAWIVACSGGAIFLVLPSHTQAVAWISGRTDVVATFLCMASFCNYLIARKIGSPLFFWSSVVLFALATLAKESTLSFPFMLVCLEMLARIGQKGKANRTWLPRVAPFFVVLALYLPLRYMAIGELGGGATNGYHPKITPDYLVHVFIHHVEGSFVPITSTPLFACLSVLVLVGLGVAIARCGSVASAAYLLIALFLLSLLPVTTLDHARHGENERFIYLPSVFSVLLIALLISEIRIHGISSRQRQWVTWTVAGGLALAFGWSLDCSCRLWDVTGRLTRQVVESAHSLPAERLVVLISPRNLKSVEMFGNIMSLESAPSLYGWTSPRTIGTWIKVSLQEPSDRVEVVQEGDIWRMRLVSDGRSIPGAFHATQPNRLLTAAELKAHCTFYVLANGHALGPEWAGMRPPPFEPGDRIVAYTCARFADVEPLHKPLALGR